MAVRANISKGYIWRPGLIGVAALSFSGWFLYDGTVKYPLQQEQHDTYIEVFQEHADPTEAGRVWETLATEKGWPTVKPTPREDKDIFTQKLLAGITAPIGLYFMATFLMTLGRWVEADEDGLRTNGGKATGYDGITSIDESRWKTKGIALVHFENDGMAGHILLDDWKFDRDRTRQIYDAVKERMPGGGAEADADEQADEQAEDTSEA